MTGAKKTVEGRVRVAVVGCGRISHNHFDAIAKIPELELVAVADIDVGRAEQEGAARGVPAFGSLDAMLGAVPLAFGEGPGSELRRPLGVAIIGGLLVSQILTLYTTPAIYILLDKLRRRPPVVSSGAIAPQTSQP